MSGKTKTLLIIAVMIGVYFIALNAMLSKGKADSDRSYGEETVSEDVIGEKAQSGIAGELAVGSVVTFGSYEQDGDFSNGKEPLEWDVIGQDGNRYLLITHYVIDGKKFDDSSSDDTLQANEAKSGSQVTWEKSSVRSWLNGDFLAETFSDEDRAAIRQVNNRTTDFLDFDTGYLGFAASDSDRGKADSIGGNDTKDSVFLLSYEEFVKYFQPIESPLIPLRMQCGKAIVSPTKYARKQGVNYRSLAGEVFAQPGNTRQLSQSYIDHLREDVSADYEENGYVCSWITRSPGCYQGGIAVMMIQSDYTCFNPGAMKDETQGIRPAIWVEE